MARLETSRRSLIGGDLDSLADVISFGVAPAVLGFTLGLRGAWDMVCLTWFVVCGVSRLARFNATAASLADETAPPCGFPSRSAGGRRVRYDRWFVAEKERLA